MRPQVAFTVPGAPAPQGSKRHVGKGVMIESSKRVKPWRTDVREAAWAAMQGLGGPWDGPVSIEVSFVYRRPPSHLLHSGGLSAQGRRYPYPYSRGDADKLLRALFDAMTGVVFHDDRQVVEVAAGKHWGQRDEARVLVMQLETLVERAVEAGAA